MNRTPPLLQFLIDVLSGFFLFGVVAVAGYGLSFVSSFLAGSSANPIVVSILSWFSSAIFVIDFILLSLYLIGIVIHLVRNLREKHGGSNG